MEKKCKWYCYVCGKLIENNLFCLVSLNKKRIARFLRSKTCEMLSKQGILKPL
jgi:hypothetical protein